METDRDRVGVCPVCDTDLVTADVLIEYRTVEGQDSFVECPGCTQVVHPS